MSFVVHQVTVVTPSGLMVVLFDMSRGCLFIVSSKKKIVYIDSPLLKTEMTVRERSHIYHEESLKLSIVKNGSVNVFRLMTEHPTNEQQISPVSSCANIHPSL